MKYLTQEINSLLEMFQINEENAIKNKLLRRMRNNNVEVIKEEYEEENKISQRLDFEQEENNKKLFEQKLNENHNIKSQKNKPVKFKSRKNNPNLSYGSNTTVNKFNDSIIDFNFKSITICLQNIL